MVAVAGIAVLSADAQRSTPQARRGSAENALVGIALFDPGTRVIAKFGSPDEILGLSVDGGSAGPTSGGGGGDDRGGAPGSSRGGGGGAPPTSRGGGGGSPGSASKSMGNEIPGVFGMVGDPFGDNTKYWRQAAGMAAPGEGGGGGGGGTRPDLGDGSGGGGGRGGAGGGGGGQGTKVIYTRWVYKRGGTKYGFVLDKFNRVVQIEAVGLSNGSVRTKRGITFGSSFGQIINKYNAPDGYEIAGDNIVVRYLVRDRVAFKLSRTKAERPHTVTAVVVAAGKT